MFIRQLPTDRSRPTAVVRMAAAAGLKAIALTDHDTQSGIAEARAEADRSGVLELIAGDRAVARVGPGGHAHGGPVSRAGSRTAPRPAGRAARRAEANATLASSSAWPNWACPSRRRRFSNSPQASRWGALTSRPSWSAAVTSNRSADAFDRYLAWGKPAYMARPRLSPEEAIGLALRIEGGADPGPSAHARSQHLRRGDGNASRGWSGLGWSASSAITRSTPPSSARVTRPLQSASGSSHPEAATTTAPTSPKSNWGSGRGNLAVADDLLDALRPA